MSLQTNTNGVNFLYNNLQASLQGSVGLNTNGVIALPNVNQLEPQSAQQMSGRNRGGLAWHGNSGVVAPNTTNAAILLDDLVTSAASLGYTKNGAFIVVCNGTTNSVVPLTNTATNTNSQAGDTVFAKVNAYILRNLSGNDGVNSAVMYINGSGTNGFKLGMNTNSSVALDGGGSSFWTESVNGFTVNAANANIIITPSANGTFGMVIMGS